MPGLVNRICSHREKLPHPYPSAAEENRLSSRIGASVDRWVNDLLARSDIMRASSRLVVSSVVAILSITLSCGLSGTAMAQTQLPSVTVVAPKQVARPHRPERVAARSASSTARTRTAQTSSGSTAEAIVAGPGSTMGKLAALEKISSNCADGCQTSFKYGNQPWNGCSGSSGDFTLSTTCRNVLNFKTYHGCRETGMFLGWRPQEVWWYCSSLDAAGKLSRERPHQVAELKRSARR